MTTFTDEQKLAHTKARLDAAITAAWLGACNPAGEIGEWDAMGYVPITTDDIELSLYATWRTEPEPGRYIWSGHSKGREGAEQCWRFHIRTWDELTDDEAEAIEELGLCLDERSADLITDPADPTVRPEIPEAIVKAWLLLEL